MQSLHNFRLFCGNLQKSSIFEFSSCILLPPTLSHTLFNCLSPGRFPHIADQTCIRLWVYSNSTTTSNNSNAIIIIIVIADIIFAWFSLSYYYCYYSYIHRFNIICNSYAMRVVVTFGIDSLMDFA